MLFNQSEMPWWFAAVLFSIGLAGYILVNQQFKLPAHILCIWRGFGVAAVMLPLVLAVPRPGGYLFYLLVSTAGLLSGLYDNLLFASSAKFGAGIISRIRSAPLILTATLWWSIHPRQFLQLFHYLPLFLGIVGCLVGCFLSVMFMRHDKISKRAFVFFIPAIVASSLLGVINKTSMAQAPLISAMPYYIFSVSLINGITNLAIYGVKKRNGYQDTVNIFSKKSITGGTIVISFVILIMASKNYGLANADNPAYVSAIGYGSALWVFLYNKVRGIKDEQSVIAGFVFLISAVSLIILTNLAN